MKKKRKKRKKGKNTKTTYALNKMKAMSTWEKAYFIQILNYYAGQNIPFIAKAIQMDRPNLLRKLKQHKLGPYEAKVVS